MRVVVARCEVVYTGRLTAVLPEATRLLLFKADGSVLVHADAGGYKPLKLGPGETRGCRTIESPPRVSSCSFVRRQERIRVVAVQDRRCVQARVSDRRSNWVERDERGHAP